MTLGNRSSELRFCDGLAGVAKSLCFLRASVGDVRSNSEPPPRCLQEMGRRTNGPSLSRRHPNFRGVGGMGGSP